MAAKDYFAHVNLAGQNPTARGIDAGYTCRKNYGSYYTYGIAENLFQNNLYSLSRTTATVRLYSAWNCRGDRTDHGRRLDEQFRERGVYRYPTFDREGIGVAIAVDNKVYITEDFC